MQFVQDVKQFDPRRKNRVKLFIFIGAFGVIGGIIALLITNAAVPLTVDTSISQPRNVRAFPDDKVITVTWDQPSNMNGIVGYYVTWKRKGSSTVEGTRQTIHRAVQLQPVVNGQEYDITVQSAQGTIQTTTIGPLGGEGGGIRQDQNRWARANGRVSSPMPASATPTSARVDAQKQRLTGFFDAFDTPANPMDESKWNQVVSSCVRPASAAAFVNTQHHTHNMIATEGWCDRSSMVSRPRATFDVTNATPSNPGQIEFDLDGAPYHRDFWYLDLIPEDARTSKLPLDITSHASIGENDHEDPGNIIRFTLRQNLLSLAYYTPMRNEDVGNEGNFLEVTGGCPNTDWGRSVHSLELYTCNMNNKSLGFSPLTESSLSLETIPNVRRHWVIQHTGTTLKIYADSTFVGQVQLPAAFAAKKRLNMHSTIFSYNTGKDYEPGGVVNTYPNTQMFHWDNFGFTGPAPTTTVHNYIDGGPNGTTPTYLFNTGSGSGRGNHPGSGVRNTIIPIPDPIGNLVDNKAYLYFTAAHVEYGGWNWNAQGRVDHVIVNGTRYNIPNPKLSMNNPPAHGHISNFETSYSAVIPINRSDIRQGNNTIQISDLNDRVAPMGIHLELPYSVSDPNRPRYTQPIQIFGQAFSNIVEPPMTNCDSYNYVEQDMDLPHAGGKANLVVGQCFYLNTTPHHEGVPPLLDMRRFEAEDAYNVTPQTTTGDDPNASKGKFITF